MNASLIFSPGSLRGGGGGGGRHLMHDYLNYLFPHATVLESNVEIPELIDSLVFW